MDRASRLRLHGAAVAVVAALGAACSGGSADGDDASSTSLYALVQGIDGVYFYPPLGPEPTPAGTFEATLLDGISVTIEDEDSSGTVTSLATFDQSTRPAVALLAERERYWVNIPAAAYVTDRSKTYRIRVLLDGTELGSSVLGAHVFDVMAWNPDLPIGVQVRIEGSGAVRSIPRTRQHVSGWPRHCTDGVRNKDETGVDCGGSCAPCCIPTPEVCDGVDNNCDGRVDEGNPGGGGACSTGLESACAVGTLTCTGGQLVCVPNVLPTAETCDRIDNDCDGVIDNGNVCGPTTRCTGTYSPDINMFVGCTTITTPNQIINNGYAMYTVILYTAIDRTRPWLGPVVPSGWQWVNNCASWAAGYPWRPNADGAWPGLLEMRCSSR